MSAIQSTDSYTVDNTDIERIADILIARKYYWDTVKKSGTSYTDFCELWNNMSYSDKYSKVELYQDSINSYKSAQEKPALNDEDKDYTNDPKLDNIILSRKAMWNYCQFQCYNGYPYDRFVEFWDSMDLEEREEIYSMYESFLD